jgi:hypothetical protein
VSDLGQDIHGQQVVINGQGSFLKDGRQFELLRSDLIVASLDGNTQTEQFELSLRHGGHDLGGDTSKVMIFHLLMLGRQVTDQSTTGVLEISTQ